MQNLKPFIIVFSLSEKAEWQKEKEMFAEMKNKLEEQQQVDAVKIQEFNVSQTNKCSEGFVDFLPEALYNVPLVHPHCFNLLFIYFTRINTNHLKIKYMWGCGRNCGNGSIQNPHQRTYKSKSVNYKITNTF